MKSQNFESVFEVIGDYPVVDQFDVLYTGLLSGSFYDNYVTGTFLRVVQRVNGTPQYAAGTRGLAFSKLGVDKNSQPDSTQAGKQSANRSYNLQPWRQRAGTVRTVKIFSDSERFYDSLVPNLSNIAKIRGVDLVYHITMPSRTNERTEISIDDSELLACFPFEPQFSSVGRVRKLSKSYSATALGPGVTDFGTTGNLVITSAVWLKSQNGVRASGDVFKSTKLPTDNFYPGPVESDVSKIIYGYGDWNPRISSTFDANGYTHYPLFLSGSYEGFHVGPTIRGWKYGLISGIPHYTSCIFRRDKYGQMRDMLEQRCTPCSIDDDQNSPVSYFGDFENPPLPSAGIKPISITNIVGKKSAKTIPQVVSSFLLDPPIKVGFVKQTIFEEQGDNSNIKKKLFYENEAPKNTWSSNLSTHATSSLPFFDGLSRNRAPFTGTPSSTVITTVDNLGNISIGITT